MLHCNPLDGRKARHGPNTPPAHTSLELVPCNKPTLARCMDHDRLHNPPFNSGEIHATQSQIPWTLENFLPQEVVHAKHADRLSSNVPSALNEGGGGRGGLEGSRDGEVTRGWRVVEDCEVTGGIMNNWEVRTTPHEKMELHRALG